MAGETTFRVRMSAEGADQMMQAFRNAAAGSAEVRKAFDQLIAASPQLASAADGVRVKVDEAARSMKAAGESSTTFGSILQGAAFGGAAGIAAKAVEFLIEKFKAFKDAIPAAGDAMKQAQARIEGMVGSATLAANVYERLATIAGKTGSSIADSSGTFTRFAVAAQDIGATTDQVLKLVSGIQSFGVVAGVSGQEAAAATRQLAQALASGRFQGDELRSVMENMPQLAAALAKELGVGLGQLRQMGADGKLTADTVFPALLAAVEGVDAKLQQMPPTMERSWNKVTVATDVFLGQLDKALGMSARIAATFDAIAAAMSGLQNRMLPTAEQAASQRLDAARSNLEGLRGRANVAQDDIQSYINQGLTREQALQLALPSMPGEKGVGERLAAAEKEFKEAEAEFTRLRQEAATAAAVDDEKAANRRIDQARTKLQQENEEWLKANDKRYKIQSEYNSKLEAIERLRIGNTISNEEAARRVALATDDYNEALKKLSPTQKEAADTSGALAEAMDKLRAKQDERFASIQTSLDPYAAALKRQADALQTLAEAETAYATSDGARGISPERAAELRVKAGEDYTKTIDNLNKKTDDTGRAFDQFFSRATSGFEDAIVKGKSFGDVMKGLEGDIARLILRLTILDPLSKALSGAFSGGSGGGGIGGLFSSAFSWLTGGSTGGSATGVLPSTGTLPAAFAMGGIMTSAGPMPLRRYAGGGIANTPQLAMFGEGQQPEAYVPLPDGRRIPVAMQGGAGMTVHHAPNITINAGGTSDPRQLAAMVEAAASRANDRLISQINRGGGIAKMVGRRR